MSIWTKIVDFVLGCNVITVTDAKATICLALDKMDADADGYVSVREIVALVKNIFKGM